MTTQVSQTVPMLLYLAAGIAGAAGQYLYKLGASRLGDVPVWRNWPLGAGVVSFCLVMVAFVAAFRMGGRLSVVYPMYATTFIWGALIGVFIERETFTAMQGIGVATIVLGCGLVAVGAGR